MAVGGCVRCCVVPAAAQNRGGGAMTSHRTTTGTPQQRQHRHAPPLHSCSPGARSTPHRPPQAGSAAAQGAAAAVRKRPLTLLSRHCPERAGMPSAACCALLPAAALGCGPHCRHQRRRCMTLAAWPPLNLRSCHAGEAGGGAAHQGDNTGFGGRVAPRRPPPNACPAPPACVSAAAVACAARLIAPHRREGATPIQWLSPELTACHACCLLAAKHPVLVLAPDDDEVRGWCPKP
jgi:hypothetical protein